MSRITKLLGGGLVLVMMSVPLAHAIDITIYDGVGTGNGPALEDQEVEPNCSWHQGWDLEAFEFNPQTWELSLVGGFDFINGFEGMAPGDVFFDVNGLPGYDYAMKCHPMDGNGYGGVLFELNEDAVLGEVLYPQNAASNPWRLVRGGDVVDPDVSVSYQANASNNSLVESLGLTGSFHNMLTVDASFLEGLCAPGDGFTVHYTMECGNDNMKGRYRANSVPDAGSTGFLALSVGAMVWLGRRKLAKQLSWQRQATTQSAPRAAVRRRPAAAHGAT
jgi:hypothetical protein